ncbi:hypothetical protein OG413_39285 [Streptomyces sp. NBC_01433]|uniref:hypothetical protein n=1 Tax=Streptomyces sp. NBC_01433 TaxID=2903864 RepID=UPI00225BAF45|nr:hypothetical protein [Streptomyces sp. NBC_01433]MCX4681247.1 hypothetical protein [Streptomyces sp. NBC_01433]
MPARRLRYLTLRYLTLRTLRNPALLQQHPHNQAPGCPADTVNEGVEGQAPYRLRV